MDVAQSANMFRNANDQHWCIDLSFEVQSRVSRIHQIDGEKEGSSLLTMEQFQHITLSTDISDQPISLSKDIPVFSMLVLEQGKFASDKGALGSKQVQR